MSKNSKEDIIRLVEEEDVEFIRLQFTDIYGNLKNMAVTTSQLDKVLNNKCMFNGVAIEGFNRNEEFDFYLYPDLDTFVIFPWRPQQGKVARIICDVYCKDGTPFAGDPRYILKKVIKEANDLGYTFDVGPECEFFLYNTDEQGNPTTILDEKGGYFDVSPLDTGENVRREIVLTLEDMGFDVETSYHAGAPSQHEIDFKYADALKTADNITTLKMVVKTIAKRHGNHATFMPKPVRGIKGSGMHVNMSLSKDGKNIFEDKEDIYGLSTTAYEFMAGIMEHIKGITVITNPLINSYKRLVAGYDAPIEIGWSAINRTPLIRIPTASGTETRIELRSPDPTANPYLSLAVCLAAGLDGIKRNLTPPPSIENKNESDNILRLPKSLDEAIKEFEKDEYIKDVVGNHFAEQYINTKKAEWNDFCTQVTAWEMEHYLYRY
ncbi:glutamine synthetase [Mobilisporobacter senegalensis]|uniref:Glutamine synthetase n=1 Tax=Mobilisporobacter senegalensis TaxID=1329262 RepID=A0A3N1XL71_9FIRM|nr:type I glutamate--ammonia ligase [Mobilisporobacter senegalensis]ROR27450.1 glutamine synthetase [Mobilisporobacter senegalensis]